MRQYASSRRRFCQDCIIATPGYDFRERQPGAGKTFTGARMICELVRRGKTVGITANSHKVIRNLINATIKAADEFQPCDRGPPAPMEAQIWMAPCVLAGVAVGG